MKININQYFLTESIKTKIEKVTICFSIIGFLVHLTLIILAYYNVINYDAEGLLKNPISSIYTPFSFILFYEVYLLIYYLPKSTSKYIGKQYEIITLIIIRKVFKDLGNLNLEENFFKSTSDLQFLIDLGTVLILFALILVFYKLNKEQSRAEVEVTISKEIQLFITFKKWVAFLLVPLFFTLSAISLTGWVKASFYNSVNIIALAADTNKIFFDNFFTTLIVTDVLILLFSFLLTDKFQTVMRNSGFIITTILIKISFGAVGVVNNIMVITALLFGVCILYIYNKYNQLLDDTNKK